MKNARLLKILLYNPIYFWFPKFLELFFTPKNTPPKSKKSKLDKIPIFFGTPCSCNYFLVLICHNKLEHNSADKKFIVFFCYVTYLGQFSIPG